MVAVVVAVAVVTAIATDDARFDAGMSPILWSLPTAGETNVRGRFFGVGPVQFFEQQIDFGRCGALAPSINVPAEC